MVRLTALLMVSLLFSAVLSTAPAPQPVVPDTSDTSCNMVRQSGPLDMNQTPMTQARESNPVQMSSQPHARKLLSNDIIEERDSVTFLRVTTLNISSQFGVFLYNGYSPSVIRNLPPQEKDDLVNLLVQNITSMAKDAASTYGGDPAVTVDVNDSTLLPSATGPVIVYAWADLDMRPDYLGFLNGNFPNGWTLEDIAYGVLNAGASARFPVTIRAEPGHNMSARVFVGQGFPSDIAVTDEWSNPPGSFEWYIINWNGTSEKLDTSHAVRMHSTKPPPDSGDVRGRFCADIYSIRFVSQGDELTLNLSISLSMHIVGVRDSLRNALPQMLSIGYINSDMLRLLYALHSSGCLNFSVDYYLQEFHGLIDSELSRIFEKEVNTNMDVDWSSLTRTIRVMNMTSAYPVNVSLAAYSVKKMLDRDIGFSSFKILSIRRTFTFNIPSLSDYDATMDYEFKFPKNIRIVNATCPGHTTESMPDNGGRWFVTFRFQRGDMDTQLKITLGADLEYDLAPLIPFLIIIAALIVVWVIVTILVYKKGKSWRRRRREEII